MENGGTLLKEIVNINIEWIAIDQYNDKNDDTKLIDHEKFYTRDIHIA